MNGAGSIALFNTDAMKWKTTAMCMPMLYEGMATIFVC